MASIDLLQQLQAERTGLLPQIAEALAARDISIIVLDDDPTGTQTVYDIPVMTTWGQTEIYSELKAGTPLFYILTNSRSLVPGRAYRLAKMIGHDIRLASKQAQREVWVISRSDSTLRGHYPGEVDSLEDGLGMEQAVRLIIPAFFEGGRYTIQDIHYVREGNELIPAAETPFAKDHTFGYEHSDLKAWIEEKTGGAVKKDSVISISIADLRQLSLEALIKKLNACSPGSTVVVNAAAYSDLEVLVLALLKSDIRPLCRTAASIVAVLTGKERRGLLSRSEIVSGRTGGGLVVVGSYVPKTSRQLAHLRANQPIKAIEVNVSEILSHWQERTQISQRYADQILRALAADQDVVCFTSRGVLQFEAKEQNLLAGQRISAVLSDIVAMLKVAPRFLIAKGGITSSDVATKALQIKRAMIQGQILPGIPVWKLGAEAKFPGMSYIVFPGNVGDDDALTEAVQKLA